MCTCGVPVSPLPSALTKPPEMRTFTVQLVEQRLVVTASDGLEVSPEEEKAALIADGWELVPEEDIQAIQSKLVRRDH